MKLSHKAPILTTGESAKLLDVTDEAVRNFCKQQKLSSFRTERGLILILRDSVEKLAAERAAKRRKSEH